MPLFNLEDIEMTHMPHRDDYDRWRGNLSDVDYEGVIAALHYKMDATPSGEHVITSSWIPGSDWTGTPYDPIYRACNESWDAARLFFGQLVWDAVQQHPERWYFTRMETGDERPIGMTYFRPSNE